MTGVSTFRRTVGAVAALTLVAGCVPGAQPAGRTTARPTPSVSPTPGTPAARLAAEERAAERLPGTPGWQIPTQGPQHAIEGYANNVSVLPGTPVTLYVSTTARSYTVTAYRMGWYGGVQARAVWHSTPQPGQLQAAAVLQAPTNTIVAPWHPSLTVSTKGWIPGDYLFRLTSSAGYGRFVPLTVRAPSAVGAVVVVNAVTTWQAYNLWGGYDLYGGGPTGYFVDRSRAVSFDRPYAFGAGAGDFLGNELPLVALVARMGLPVDYVTSVDLARYPGLLAGARAVISLGHDEYWSGAMRTAVTDARNAGTNVAFLGANAVFRHIRFGSTPVGPYRLEICYKVATEDPLYGKDNSRVTSNWPSPPVPRPESTLTGTFYRSYPVTADMVVVAANSWIFAGTGVHNGSRLTGLVGSEFDRVDLAVPTPRPIEILFHSPVVVRGRPDVSDAAYYTTPSGAGVFDSGTASWVCAIENQCGPGRTGPQNAPIVSRITENLLRAFAAGPAGRVHPAVDNVAQFY